MYAELFWKTFPKPYKSQDVVFTQMRSFKRILDVYALFHFLKSWNERWKLVEQIYNLDLPFL